MIKHAFEETKCNPGFFLTPLLLDLASSILGLVTAGFWGESGFSFKLILEVGIPSIGSILKHNVLAGGAAVGLADTGIDGPALFYMILLIIIGAFLEGGFIGLLYEKVARNQAPSLETFLHYSKKFWARFLGLRLMVSGVLFLGLLLAMVLSFVGLFAFFIAFLVLRIRYIYWEFTLVSEDLSIGAAFTRSAEHFKNRSQELTNLIIVMVGFNFLAGLTINLLWHPIVLAVGIPIYAYLGTSLQLALMYTKPDLGDQTAGTFS